MMNEQKKLAAYLLKRYNLSWEKYIQRFEGTRPLILDSIGTYPLKFEPQPLEAEIDLFRNLSSPILLKKFEKQYRFVAGFTSKVTLEEIENLDYIAPNFAGVDILLHKRVIDIMQKICPDDFEPIQFTLISLNKHVQTFETKNFYAINVLKCVNFFDETRYNMTLREALHSALILNGYPNNPWSDGIRLFYNHNDKLDYELYHLEKPCKIATKAHGAGVFWHPELAKELPISSLAGFFLDTEIF